MKCFFVFFLTRMYFYFMGSQFLETALIGGVYSMTANEVLSGKEL